MSDALPDTALRLTLSKEQAARSLDMSVDSLERHVLPDLKLVRAGRLVRVPIRELERWVELNAARTLPADHST